MCSSSFHTTQAVLDREDKAWLPKDVDSQEQVTILATLHELTKQQAVAAEEVVPWFLRTMPQAYFRAVPHSTTLEHLKAITALYGSSSDNTLTLRSTCPETGAITMTFIRPGSTTGLLLKQIQSLPSDLPADLSRVKVFTSHDNTLSLNIFSFEAPEEQQKLGVPEDGAAHILDYARELQAGKHDDDEALAHIAHDPMFEREALLDFFDKCTPFYIANSSPRRFCIQRELYEAVTGTDNIAIEIMPFKMEQRDLAQMSTLDPDKSYSWISMACTNILPKVALQKMGGYLANLELDVVRSHLDVVTDPGNGNVSMIRMLVAPVHSENNAKWAPNAEAWKPVAKDLKRLKWVDDEALKMSTILVNEGGEQVMMGLDRAEIVSALVSLLHTPMVKEHPYAFRRSRMFELVRRTQAVPHAVAIADLFLARFDPANPLTAADFEAQSAELAAAISSSVEDAATVELLQRMREAVGAALRTNIYLPDRYALSMRVDPSILEPQSSNTNETSATEARELPFGVFFVHGRRFNGFHVRFRDIARGGLRVVSPTSTEQFSLEGARQYDEAYGLAFAQQLKNKDIPEGGSKAVVLIQPSAQTGDDNIVHFSQRKSVKAFADSILDLISTDPDVQRQCVDYWGKPELLYLGPDENIIPEDINWAIDRARRRGYPIPAAFMSSKPDAGINHKEYGVTSEGVNVNLEIALKYMGINPREKSFTVKITGGPDGDVAGNEIKILHREYGDNAKVVGLADGFGCAEDPDGLDMQELLRLVELSLPITHFDEGKLGPNGVIMAADTAEGAIARNSMHNRVVADAFVPAGGRPSTINGDNWRDFILPSGKASSPLVVEGANLFTTKDAREKLFREAGVLFVKDSSANKCGVICSSFEIVSSMLLDTDEFLDVKDEVVNDVLVKLRELARLEAELLFREFDSYPGALPDFSERISAAINRATDAVQAALDGKDFDDLVPLMGLVSGHLPQKLVDVAFDRLDERVPLQYIKNMIAAPLASRMVYNEGIMYVETLPYDSLAKKAFAYVEEEANVQSLVEELDACNLGLDEEKQTMLRQILLRGGARTLLDQAGDPLNK